MTNIRRMPVCAQVEGIMGVVNPETEDVRFADAEWMFVFAWLGVRAGVPERMRGRDQAGTARVFGDLTDE
jgi:hypothetical protein